MTASPVNTQPVYSSLGADPDLGELVELFVDEMPDRIQTLRDAAEGNDSESMQRSAHQLKGAAGSYGFDQITPFAAQLESALRDERCESDIRESLASLIDICSRVRAGSPE